MALGEVLRVLLDAVTNEVLPEAELRESNSLQFEDGVSFVKVNNLLKALAMKKDCDFSSDNPDYQHFLIDLNSSLKKWRENWKKLGLDIDIAINSIHRV